MAAVDDWYVWARLSDQGDKSRHLRVVDDDYVCTTDGKGAPGGEPAALGVGEDPFVNLGALGFC